MADSHEVDRPEGIADDTRAAERRKDFTRRALLRAGWTVPLITTVNIPSAFAQSPPPDPPHLDHTDHADVPHTDHADAPHTDHADAPHTDHADAPHTDAPHTDHTDVPHTDHVDLPHEDHQDHVDTHVDVPA